MAGPVLIVIALLVLLPVGTLIGGAVLTIILGFLLKTDVDQSHEGSELLELNIEVRKHDPERDARSRATVKAH